MTFSQNDAGRAFEYGIAARLSEHLPAAIQSNVQLVKAEHCFKAAPATERQNIVAASREVVAFLAAHDPRLSDTGCSVRLQSDQLGQQGDVRDVIIHNSILNAEIGISVKNRHFAVKHSRLSERIDFGADWLGTLCSQTYFHTITPIFQELRMRQRKGELWRDIPDKSQCYYLPILQAFQGEMLALFKPQQAIAAKALIQYLLGRFDFYKVIKENGDVSIMSFNSHGTLKWGGKLPMPTRCIELSIKPQSATTLIMTFDKGWQLSFRIHSASSRVEPSLKFDINIVGLPQTISRHVIPYQAD